MNLQHAVQLPFIYARQVSACLLRGIVLHNLCTPYSLCTPSSFGTPDSLITVPRKAATRVFARLII